MKVSVIIPVCGMNDNLVACLEALTKTEEDYRTIIVNSYPPNVDEELGDIVFNCSHPLSYSEAINCALSEADWAIDGPVVVINDDVIVCNGWLDRLLPHLAVADVVGPVTNNISGDQQIVTKFYSDEKEFDKIASGIYISNKGRIRPSPRLVGFCVLMKKEVLDSVGSYDEQFKIGNFEDDDYCLRAIEEGFKLGVAEDVFVHHVGGSTFTRLKIDYNALLETNRKLFHEKWKDKYSGVIEQHRVIWEGGKVEKDLVKLNLGCGYRRIEGYINLDNRKDVSPDVVVDIAAGLPYADNSVDEVRAYDFLEHIHPDKVVFVMEEIHRVLKSGGKFESFTPSTDGRGAFQDPTHRSFWNMNSWLYYMNDSYRSLYGIKAKFGKSQKGEGFVRNVITPPKEYNVIHVHVELYAVK